MKRVYTHTHVKFYLSFCSALVLLAKMYESQKILYNKNQTDPTYTKKTPIFQPVSPLFIKVTETHRLKDFSFHTLVRRVQ